MIEFREVSKSFRLPPGPGRRGGIVAALRNVSAVIAPGGVTGIAGPNGAGKTTLFGLLLGFLEASAGEVTIEGADPRAYVRRHGANYLPERFQLPRDWTVQAALAGLLALEGAAARLADVMRQFALETVATARTHTLSRGTLQRVALAQAVGTPRTLIVLDEPTEGLDPFWRIRFREIVRALRSPERTILIASHELTELERLADRVLILSGGTVAEIVELRPQDGQPTEYTLTLTQPHDALSAVFPGAQLLDHASYLVRVAGAADLSARLAALLAAGATVIGVTPSAGLEQRITGMRPGPGVT